MGAASAQQARVIVNNALKLYSQDKTGMVDFALESGGECPTPQPRAGAGTWVSARQPEGEQYSRCVPAVRCRHAGFPERRLWVQPDDWPQQNPRTTDHSLTVLCVVKCVGF